LATHQIRYAGDSDRKLWDGYVQNHPAASLYHLFGWRDVIQKSYGHQTYYVMAIRSHVHGAAEQGVKPGSWSGNVVGILPLAHLKHRIFGNCLVSLPFLDSGGILADDREAEESIFSEAIRLGRELGVSTIELRQEQSLATCNGSAASWIEDTCGPLNVAARSDKVRMLLKLPESSDALLKSFPSKLRNQVRKPLKEGFVTSLGSLELLENFYKVFVVNMRDLGSPAHSREFMRSVLTAFGEHARIVLVSRSKEPMAAALVVGVGNVLRNPWAASIRKYASLGPNMLLYLRMLEYACESGYRAFDFGRATKGEGTYRFKEQWGAVPVPLYWYLISLNGKPIDPKKSGAERFRWAAYCWRQLPLEVTKILGPRIRKHISL